MAVVSEPVEAEYRALSSKRDVRRLLLRKDVDVLRFEAAISAFCAVAERVAPTGEPPRCRDEDDRKYLHCVVAARADYLVTYDDDLLQMGRLDDARIVTPSEMARQLREAGLIR